MIKSSCHNHYQTRTTVTRCAEKINRHQKRAQWENDTVVAVAPFNRWNCWAGRLGSRHLSTQTSSQTSTPAHTHLSTNQTPIDSDKKKRLLHFVIAPNSHSLRLVCLPSSSFYPICILQIIISTAPHRQCRVSSSTNKFTGILFLFIVWQRKQQ